MEEFKSLKTSSTHLVYRYGYKTNLSNLFNSLKTNKIHTYNIQQEHKITIETSKFKYLCNVYTWLVRLGTQWT